ncbi:hypothetical protein HYW58_01180 [Candidatus Kaiserbacteria bacterium]|nr:hypothetical protein [Candidatus Kaiserbacteria bacterium]
MWKPLSKAEEKKRKEKEEKEKKEERKRQKQLGEKLKRDIKEEKEEEKIEKEETRRSPSGRAARLLIKVAKEIRKRGLCGTFEILGKPGNSRVGVLAGSLYNYTAHFESRPGRALLEIKCVHGRCPEIPAGYFSLAIPIKPDKIESVAQRLEDCEVTSIEIKRFIKKLGLKL